MRIQKFPKPVGVVSKCLGFEVCRYNQQIISDYFVDQLAEPVDFIPVGLEVEIGLGIPQDPVRLGKENSFYTNRQPVKNFLMQ